MNPLRWAEHVGHPALGAQLVCPGAGGVDHHSTANGASATVQAVAEADACHPLLVPLEVGDLGVADDGSAVLGRRADRDEGQASVVHQTVEVAEAASQPVPAQGWLDSQQLVGGEHLVTANTAGAGQQVVGNQAHLQSQAAVGVALVDRQDVGEGVNQVRGDLQQHLPLLQGFPHQTNLARLEVAQAAVDHLGRLAAGACGEVPLLQEGHR